MSLLDPKWKYTHSTATDIRKTFAKARRTLAQKQKAEVRPAKLHLMCAPSEESGFGSRPKSSLFGTRRIAESGSHQNDDASAIRCAGNDRRIA